MTTTRRTPSFSMPHDGFVALVVDRDPASRLELRTLLESQGGHVIEVEDGASARSVFGVCAPDVVLLRLEPGSDGLRVCAQIGTLPSNLSTPILAILDVDDEVMVNLALEAGAADYVTLPIRPAILRQRLYRLLQAHSIDAAIIRGKREWEAAFDAVSDLILLTDLNGRINRCNAATIQRLQSTYPQVIGADISSVLLEGSALNPGAPSGKPREVYLPRLSGWFEVRAFSGHTEGGWHTIVYILKDISDRKRLEEDIWQSEQRFKALVENIEEGIELFDVTGQVLYASPMVARILGASSTEDLVGLNPMVNIHPDDLERNRALFTELIQKPGSSFTSELRTRHANGSWIWAEAHVYNMLEEPGINAVLVNFRDITERKQAELKLRQLSQAVEQSPISIVITDTAGNIEYVNPRFTQLTGYTFEEIVRQNPRILNSGQTPPETHRQLWETVTAGREWHGEFVNAKKNGELFVERASISPVVDSEGTITHFLALKEDITQTRQLEQAMQRNEKRFRAMIENSADAIALVDDTGTIAYMSSAITNISGYQPEHYLGHSTFEFVHSLDAPGLLEGFSRLVQTPTRVTTGLFRSPHIDGSWCWVSTTSCNKLDDPAVQAIIVNFRDVTENQRSEEILRASEERYRALFEDSPVALWEEDFSEVKAFFDRLREEGVNDFRLYFESHPDAVSECANRVIVKDVNKAAMKMLDATRKEQLFSALNSIVVPESSSAFREELISIANGHSHYTFEGPHRTLNGDIKHVRVLWSVWPGYEDTLSNIMVSVIDLTERKQSEAALAESEQRFRQFFTLSPDAVMVIDPGHPVHWTIVDCNEAACQMNGYTREEIIGQSVDLLNQSVGTASERTAYLERLRREGIMHLESFHRHKDGHLFPVEISTTLFTFGGRELILGIDRDITERKRAEEALQLSEERFQMVTHATNDAVWDLNLLTNEVWWNRGMSSLFGYAADQVGKMDDWWEERIHPEDRPKVLASFKKALTSDGRFWSKEYRFRRANGTYAYVFDRAYIIADELGAPVRAIGAIMDITDQKQAEAALRLREQQLEEAQQTAHLGSWEWDLNTNRVTWSDELYRLCGWEPRSITPSHEAFMTLIHPEDQEEVFQIVKEATQCHRAYDFDYRIISAIGQTRWLHGHGEFINDEMGQIVKARGTAQDITERKQAEEALRTSQAELSEALQIAKLAYWEYDTSTNEFVFNDHFYAIFHTTAAQEGGYRMSSAQYAQRFCHPDDLTAIGIEIEKALNARERHYHIQLDHRILYAEGGVGYISVRVYVDRDEQGQILRYYGANQDVTERKHMEEALKQSEELFSKAFHASPAPMGITRLDDGMIIDVNASWERLLQFDRQAVIGHTLLDLNIYANPEDRVMVIEQVREQGKLLNYELKFKSATGEELILLLSAQRIEIQGQDCLLNSLYNITDLRRIHDTMLASQKLADLGTLAAGVAHEMNSPLQVITGVSQSLLRKSDNGTVEPEQLRRNLDVIHRNGWRCAEIVRSLHTYARTSGGSMQAVNMNELISDSLLLIEHQLKSWANITVQTILADDLPALTCDRNQITQVLINLLTNARDAMPGGGAITIATDHDLQSDQLILQISDNGTGIPDSIRSKIFDPFFTTKPLGKGTGLGLSIVVGIVRAHAGTIDVNDALPQGTTFTARFPVKPPRLPASDAGNLPGRFDDIASARTPAEQAIL